MRYNKELCYVMLCYIFSTLSFLLPVSSAAPHSTCTSSLWRIPKDLRHFAHPPLSSVNLTSTLLALCLPSLLSTDNTTHYAILTWFNCYIKQNVRPFPTISTAAPCYLLVSNWFAHPNRILTLHWKWPSNLTLGDLNWYSAAITCWSLWRNFRLAQRNLRGLHYNAKPYFNH